MFNSLLRFYSLLDFYPKKDDIKRVYQGMSLRYKRLYKMYVYSIGFENENIKDLIWEYLNDWEESKFILALEYRKKKQKVERMR